MFANDRWNRTVEEARKTLETFGNLAQAELRGLLDDTGRSTREHLGTLGQELERLGRRMQELASRPPAPPAA